MPPNKPTPDGGNPSTAFTPLDTAEIQLQTQNTPPMTAAQHKAKGDATAKLVRLIIVGFVLGILSVVYAVGLFSDKATLVAPILGLLGTGLGYLLGDRDK